jgi:hypothetical protein
MFERHMAVDATYSSQQMPDDRLKHFYGAENPLKVQYVKDLTNGGKLASRDVELIPLGKPMT